MYIQIVHTVSSVHCAEYSVRCTVSSVHCAEYSVQCTVYSVQRAVYDVRVHWTAYRTYSTFPIQIETLGKQETCVKTTIIYTAGTITKVFIT